MKKSILLLAAIVWVHVVNAQGPSRTEMTHGASFSLVSLQYNLELPVSRLATVNFHGGLGADIGFQGLNSWDGWVVGMRGIVGADLRYYHNLDRRAAKGKNISANSGNFWAVDLVYATPPFYTHNTSYEDNSLLIWPAYGIRRVYRSGIFIEGRFGWAVGLDFDKHGKWWGHRPKLDFKFGYNF